MYRFIFSFIVMCLVVTQPSFANDIPGIVKRVKPSVVMVVTYDYRGNTLGQGSGFFIENKRVVTNFHVLKGAHHGDVRLTDGRIFPIEKLYGYDAVVDLAIFSISSTSQTFPTLKLADFIPEEGERILAIGSPRGLESTVSDGIVSSIRNIPEVGQVIQMTTPISPGSSGGPVVNMKGEVVGVSTAFIKDSQNINFAIPYSAIRMVRTENPKRLSEVFFGAKEVANASDGDTTVEEETSGGAGACTMADGEIKGRNDGKKGQPLEWLAGGACAGGLCGCIGCLGATGLAYVLDPEVPEVSCNGSKQYEAGYAKGYTEVKKEENAKHAFIGGILGVAAIVVLVLIL